jgi:hypothetical protein
MSIWLIRRIFDDTVSAVKVILFRMKCQDDNLRWLSRTCVSRKSDIPITRDVTQKSLGLSDLWRVFRTGMEALVAYFKTLYSNYRSSVNIVPRLRAGRQRFDSREGQVFFFYLHHSVQTGSGTHPDSYPVGSGVSFLRGKSIDEWSWPLTSI